MCPARAFCRKLCFKNAKLAAPSSPCLWLALWPMCYGLCSQAGIGLKTPTALLGRSSPHPSRKNNKNKRNRKLHSCVTDLQTILMSAQFCQIWCVCSQSLCTQAISQTHSRCTKLWLGLLGTSTIKRRSNGAVICTYHRQEIR